MLPDQQRKGSSGPSANLLRPEAGDPSAAVVTEEPGKAPPANGKGGTGAPPSSTFPPPPRGPSLPVGIADFAQVKPDVTTGLKPDLDGLGWLKDRGYRTIVFLKKPGEEDAADRRLVERHGMRFIALQVSPESLNAATVEEFNRTINDPSGRPVFVYDRDGTTSGSMWYLYFRTSDLLGDDEARLRAGRVGLKEKGTPEQMAMWLAVQKYLAR
jgi:protein tyrosine phosphatase (PTP) superfamily phosphohydrolase (DUF442 family)